MEKDEVKLKHDLGKFGTINSVRLKYNFTKMEAEQIRLALKDYGKPSSIRRFISS